MQSVNVFRMKQPITTPPLPKLLLEKENLGVVVAADTSKVKTELKSSKILNDPIKHFRLLNPLRFRGLL